ncbi:MAG TPA: DUF2127 domain-containing protein [Blastocatellia bacterium]|nr:DUF2127 domain-containing protein [Blastocatellia bacterium]
MATELKETEPTRSAQPETAAREHRPRDTGLWLIGLFKLAKGLLLIVAGAGALKLIHHDVGGIATRVIEAIHVDPDNKYVHKLLNKLLLVDDHRLRAISAGSFVYAALVLTEGFGLIKKKHWAEYLTVVATALLMPLEVYEITRRVTFTRIAILILNGVIVWYLIWKIRSQRPSMGDEE